MLPSPPAEMNYQTTPNRKRSRSNIEAEETRDSTFQLENLSTSSCLTFEPISKLLRAHLPLSWLGSAAANTFLPSGTILQGQIKHVTSWEYSVLISRHIPNGGLYALEKVEDACFVVHPLQPFVDVKWVKDASIGAAPPVSMQMLLHYVPIQESFELQDLRRTPSMTASEAAFKVPKNRRGAAARLSILSQTDKQDGSIPSPRLQDLSQHFESPVSISHTVAEPPLQVQPSLGEIERAEKPESAITTEPSTIPDESQSDLLIPAYLRQRYLDHLYKVKTSLAFYVKGPLSRARARARVENASMTIADLASFYRDSILPAKKMDLKYKESLKDVISSIVKEPTATEGGTTMKKPSKKTKLGKDGLWPTEPDFVRFWWYHRDSKTTMHSEDHASELQSAITAQRMREAQMQMILILEVLAIEAKQNEKKDASQQPVPESADIKAESIEQEAPLDVKPEKRIKKRHLEAELETLADRLCIWHSVGLEVNNPPNGDSKGNNEGDDQHDSRDRLRNFCTDILIAFYNHRLPVLCRSLCKTLAGPALYDQIQKETRVKQDSATRLPPGAALSRVPSRRGTLERVLSEEALRQHSPPALMRSSTLPITAPLKREASERYSRPPSRQTSVSFSNREVDLAADAQVTASKKRKLDMVASQKQELAAAIHALKKPNRQDAGKGYMDDLEQRKLQLKQPVLITATPRANRRKHVGDTRDDPTMLPPAVSDTTIPSSSTKPRMVEALVSAQRSSSKKRAVLAAIHDTPSRGASRKSDPLQVNNRSASRLKPDGGPISAQEAIFATPSKPKQKNLNEVFTTPIKLPKRVSDEKENEFGVTDMASKTMDRAMAMPAADTLYDTLGWNDDYDL
ncbi:hypothetical protein PMZ80_000639 [Knufia obscura]|uniref:DNA replication regulator Sld3 C-terminal domain-containing protein n=2 Tax=Knufia TaxID=430999 RepID=A0AAN8EYR2_9EURO|nr:hypothetical protein PMZ80_000639 [Knufia obscura]KAK5948521.1 hypothetical protein OHC33_010417 [Knufia fluminis]